MGNDRLVEGNGVSQQDHGGGMRCYGDLRTCRFEFHQLKLVCSLAIHFNAAAGDIEEDVGSRSAICECLADHPL